VVSRAILLYIECRAKLLAIKLKKTLRYGVYFLITKGIFIRMLMHYNITILRPPLHVETGFYNIRAPLCGRGSGDYVTTLVGARPLHHSKRSMAHAIGVDY
jgi:hypothetical protein